MPSREELLQSIQPDMKLDKAFFLRVYGYEISYPGFSETAIKALEDAGCSKARNYYEQITTEYENKYHEGQREAAERYSKQLYEKWERQERTGDETRKQEKKTRLSRDDVSTQILGW